MHDECRNLHHAKEIIDENIAKGHQKWEKSQLNKRN